MGSVFNRGMRQKPSWYIKFRDLDGEWRMRPSGPPTKAMAQRVLGQVESRIAAGKVGIEQPRKQDRVGPLMDRWAKGLTNRNADDDRTRLKRHLLPKFGKMTVPAAEKLAVVLDWIDAQRAEGRISEASICHNLNLLSRFFSWEVERGYASVNPVRQIPVGRRPQQSPLSATFLGSTTTQSYGS